ncbi:hypothetical protein CHS0354_006945 [Potamilus streckersoni]|uniref:Uncharacterized protein n=1 Tax=Potamilus streckersoni TaxID=2493646 RepID=A0AAE0TEL8_9BIVA|nr:hypothetical protein CHS0354_006945 [Potamilus streckersoni]
MQYSEWHKYDYSKGRQYSNHKNIYSKYDEKELIKDRICEALKEIVRIESAVRITTDTHLSDSERLIISIPYECDYEKMIRNFSDVLYHSFLAYYFQAEPKTNHFGISNTILEGHLNSFLIREAENIFSQFKYRDDMSGRFLKEVNFAKTNVKDPGDNYMKDTLMRGVDITLGYRAVMFGNKVNGNSLFIPVPDGYDVIAQVYYNLEHLIHQNFAIYDELNDRDYLKVSDTLIFKELVSIMKRAKQKENLRKKILNNVRFPTFLTENPNYLYGALAGDLIYDTLNHVDDPVIREASDRSRELFNTYFIRTTEITQSTIDINNLKLNTTGTSYIPEEQAVYNPLTANGGDGLMSSVTASSSKAPEETAVKTPKKLQEDDLIEL